MSNYNGDLLDDGLQSVMGKDRCKDVWTIMPEGAEALLERDRKRSDSRKTVDAKKKEVRKDKPVEAQWEPVKEKPNQLDKLKACAKDALLYGALALMFFYFQQTGQMELTASMPCICACVLLGGIGIGKHSVEG